MTIKLDCRLDDLLDAGILEFKDGTVLKLTRWVQSVDSRPVTAGLDVADVVPLDLRLDLTFHQAQTVVPTVQVGASLCGCGSQACGSPVHSSWCPLFRKV